MVDPSVVSGLFTTDVACGGSDPLGVGRRHRDSEARRNPRRRRQRVRVVERRADERPVRRRTRLRGRQISVARAAAGWSEYATQHGMPAREPVRRARGAGRAPPSAMPGSPSRHTAAGSLAKGVGLAVDRRRDRRRGGRGRIGRRDHRPRADDPASVRGLRRGHPARPSAVDHGDARRAGDGRPWGVERIGRGRRSTRMPGMRMGCR